MKPSRLSRAAVLLASAFRRALRDALESTRGLVDANGVVNMSTTDHRGLDGRARVMVEISDGKWVCQPH